MKALIHVLVAVQLLIISSLSYGQSIEKFVVFGDSLSDTGNGYRRFLFTAPKPPYYAGRYSNGPLWSEYLVNMFPGAVLEDHAFVAADTGDGSIKKINYQAQIKNHIKANRDADFSNTLHISFIGNINYLYIVRDGIRVTDADVSKTVSQIKTGLELLVDAGAKNLFVLNLPDLGITPWTLDNEKAGVTIYKEYAHDAIVAHNTALATMVASYSQTLAKTHPDVRIEVVDVFGYFNDILAEIRENPETQPYIKTRPGHLPNLTERCYTGDFFGNNGTVCAHPEEYVFWDEMHPTTTFDEAIASKVKGIMVEEYGYDVANSKGVPTPEEQAALDSFNRLMNPSQYRRWISAEPNPPQ